MSLAVDDAVLKEIIGKSELPGKPLSSRVMSAKRFLSGTSPSSSSKT